MVTCHNPIHDGDRRECQKRPIGVVSNCDLQLLTTRATYDPSQVLPPATYYASYLLLSNRRSDDGASRAPPGHTDRYRCG